MTDELTTIYEDSFHEGVRLAEYAIESQMPTGALELELRQEASTAVDTAHTDAGRAQAVRRLGIVRGFRDVVRSGKGG